MPAVYACRFGQGSKRMGCDRSEDGAAGTAWVNLNTLLRHDVFNVVARSVDPTSARLTVGAVNDNMVNYIAERIADKAEVRRSRVLVFCGIRKRRRHKVPQ